MSKSLSDNLKALMHALAASAEAFLHHAFGERYASVMVHTLLLAVLVSLAAPLLSPDTPAPLMPLFSAAFIVRLLAHLVSVWRRRRTGVHIPSRARGTSWRVWSELRLPAGVIHGLVEPLVCLAASFLVAPVDRVLSIWLRFAALSLVIKTTIQRHQGHEQTLDTLDDLMSARNRHAAGRQQTNPRLPAADTSVTLNTPLTQGPAQTVPGLFRNLDPALQRLMQENQPGPRPEPGAVQVRPAHQKSTPEPAARPSGTWGVAPGAGAIHVRPAQSINPTPPTVAPPARPRVVLVRTRPAPQVPSPATPGMPPGWFGTPVASPAAISQTEQNGGAIPSRWPAPVPNRSETAPRPPPAEVRSPDPVERTASAPSDAIPVKKPAAPETPGEAERCDPERGIDDYATLRQRIREEATKLGFAVEAGVQLGAEPLSVADLALTKAGLSLAVQIAAPTTTSHELAKAKKCLDAGIARIAIVSPRPERLKAIAEAMHTGLPIWEAMKVSMPGGWDESRCPFANGRGGAWHCAWPHGRESFHPANAHSCRADTLCAPGFTNCSNWRDSPLWPWKNRSGWDSTSAVICLFWSPSIHHEPLGLRYHSCTKRESPDPQDARPCAARSPKRGERTVRRDSRPSTPRTAS